MVIPVSSANTDSSKGKPVPKPAVSQYGSLYSMKTEDALKMINADLQKAIHQLNGKISSESSVAKRAKMLAADAAKRALENAGFTVPNSFFTATVFGYDFTSHVEVAGKSLQAYNDITAEEIRAKVNTVRDELQAAHDQLARKIRVLGAGSYKQSLLMFPEKLAEIIKTHFAE